MDKKNSSQKRNERPSNEGDERNEKGGIKTEPSTQGLKSDATKLPEADPDVADDAIDDAEEDES